MNHTVAYKIYTAPATSSSEQNHKSILRKIVARLNTILMSRCPKNKIRSKHKSFMEANLLDDVMGPEISRTLRR